MFSNYNQVESRDSVSKWLGFICEAFCLFSSAIMSLLQCVHSNANKIYIKCFRIHYTYTLHIQDRIQHNKTQLYYYSLFQTNSNSQHTTTFWVQKNKYTCINGLHHNVKYKNKDEQEEVEVRCRLVMIVNEFRWCITVNDDVCINEISLDTQLSSSPVSSLSIVSDLVISSQSDPLWQWSVLFLSLGQFLLGSEWFLRL